MNGLNFSRSETDRELLDRFAVDRSAETFRALVARHGPLVYHTCLRVLGNAHEAEDAAQAVFIVLFQRPPTVQSLAGWLHAVARKTALKMIRGRLRRTQREKVVAAMKSQALDPTDDGLGEALDAALGALPAAEREVVILRYLEEQGVEEVARRLGCSISTVSTRATQALNRMARYFHQRGLSVAAPALAIHLAQQGACASAANASATAALMPVALGPGAWTAPAVHLANAVIKTMFWTKVAVWGGFSAAALLAFGIALGLVMASEPPPDVVLNLSPQVFTGHTSRIVQMAFSADGTRLASIDDRQRLLIWDVAARRPRHTFTMARSQREGERSTAALALAPDGATVAETVQKWSADLDFLDVGTGLQRSVPFGDGVAPVRLAAFSPDGKQLVTGQRLMAWDVSSGRRLWERKQGRVLCLTFLPTRQAAAVAFEGGGVEVLAGKTGMVEQSLLPTTSVQAMTATPDGTGIVVWTGDSLAQYDLASGRMLTTRRRSGTAPGLLGCSAHGVTLLTADQVIRQPWPLGGSAAAAALPPRSTAVALAANGRRFALARADHAIHVYDLFNEP